METNKKVRCFGCMYRHIANNCNVPYYKEQDYDPTMRKGKGIFTDNMHWVINGEDVGALTKNYRKGGVQVLTSKDGRDFPIDIKVDRRFAILINAHELLEAIPPKQIGRHREDEGNGWYSTPKKYEVAGKHFADITCYGHCGYDIKLESHGN